jgi:hypothetical protein
MTSGTGIAWSVMGVSAGLSYNYLALLSLMFFVGGVTARWVYLWLLQGWDGGSILGKMPLACCGIINQSGWHGTCSTWVKMGWT